MRLPGASSAAQQAFQAGLSAVNEACIRQIRPPIYGIHFARLPPPGMIRRGASLRPLGSTWGCRALSTKDPKLCLYELLGVPQSADQGAIKEAFRQVAAGALRTWHARACQLSSLAPGCCSPQHPAATSQLPSPGLV